MGNSIRLPQSLYVEGQPHALNLLERLPEHGLAIVGTRYPQSRSRDFTQRLIRDLRGSDLIIISGLALGIDAAAHRGALAGGGRTIAVLGNGIDEIYPAQNEKLANEILNTGGAIVSEYGPGEPSFRQNFIHRNRIISGLSVAVVVVEAPMKSGALATAGFAAEQGRSVFVVPGPVTHPNYIGSHGLVRDGAILVTKARDILEDLGLLQETEMRKQETGIRELPPQLNLDTHESLILEVIKNTGEPIYVDRIASIAKLEAQVVNQSLTGLLLKGLIRETNGRYEVGYR